MKSILDTCTPRPDLLAGTFNPEIFTASLSQVMDHYRGRSSRCWDEVARQMDAGMSGVLTVTDWAIGFFDDGLIATRPRTSLETAAVLFSLKSQL